MSDLVGKAAEWVVKKEAEKQIHEITDKVNDAIGDMINGVLGKAQPPIYELLEKYGMMKGIFPKDILRYEFEKLKEDDDDGKLTVYLKDVVEAKFSDETELRWNTVVTGTFRALKYFDIEGIKFNGLLGWSRVNEIRVDLEDNQIYFYGHTRKGRELEAFKEPIEATKVEEF